jgi:hypothetical protein
VSDKGKEYPKNTQMVSSRSLITIEPAIDRAVVIKAAVVQKVANGRHGLFKSGHRTPPVIYQNAACAAFRVNARDSCRTVVVGIGGYEHMKSG